MFFKGFLNQSSCGNHLFCLLKSPCVRHSFPFLPFWYAWQAQYMHWNLKYLCVDNTVPLITANEAPCLFHGISSERERVKSCRNHFKFFASSFKTFVKTLFTPTTQWQMHLEFHMAFSPLVHFVKAVRPDPLTYNTPMTCGPPPGRPSTGGMSATERWTDFSLYILANFAFFYALKFSGLRGSALFFLPNFPQDSS